LEKYEDVASARNAFSEKCTRFKKHLLGFGFECSTRISVGGGLSSVGLKYEKALFKRALEAGFSGK
jgi:hypothetical protein